MSIQNNDHEFGKPLMVAIPKKEKIYLDDLLAPIRIIGHHHHHRHGCCCCCGHTSAHVVPQTGLITVQFNATARTLIVGSTIFPEANFEWNATGSAGLKVDVQVKSSVSFPNWRNVLTDQPPADVGSWNVVGLPGETFYFRAVATDPQGNIGYSRIVTL